MYIIAINGVKRRDKSFRGAYTILHGNVNRLSEAEELRHVPLPELDATTKSHASYAVLTAALDDLLEEVGDRAEFVKVCIMMHSPRVLQEIGGLRKPASQVRPFRRQAISRLESFGEVVTQEVCAETIYKLTGR